MSTPVEDDRAGGRLVQAQDRPAGASTCRSPTRRPGRGSRRGGQSNETSSTAWTSPMWRSKIRPSVTGKYIRRSLHRRAAVRPGPGRGVGHRRAGLPSEPANGPSSLGRRRRRPPRRRPPAPGSSAGDRRRRGRVAGAPCAASSSVAGFQQATRWVASGPDARSCAGRRRPGSSVGVLGPALVGRPGAARGERAAAPARGSGRAAGRRSGSGLGCRPASRRGIERSRPTVYGMARDGRTARRSSPSRRSGRRTSPGSAGSSRPRRPRSWVISMTAVAGLAARPADAARGSGPGSSRRGRSSARRR